MQMIPAEPHPEYPNMVWPKGNPRLLPLKGSAVEVWAEALHSGKGTVILRGPRRRVGIILEAT